MRTVEEVPRVLYLVSMEYSKGCKYGCDSTARTDHLRDAKTLVIIGFIVGKFYLFKQYSCGSN